MSRTAPRHPAPPILPATPAARAPLALVGPTAAGKTALALALARSLGDVEIVSIDSMQVYRGLDIGTAKPTARERAEVPHHLIDVVEPSEEFSLARFQAAAAEALLSIEARGHRALLVGGTGLYLRAVVDGLALPGRFPDHRAALEAEPDTGALHRRLAGLDPLAATRMQPSNRRRVVRALEVTLGSGRPFSSYGPGLATYQPTRFRLIGLSMPIARLDERIAARFAGQMEAGLLTEVRSLAARPDAMSPTARQALGYLELLSHLEGGVGLDAAVAEAVRRTRAFARRQRAWFRRDPRITWLPGLDGCSTSPPALLGHWS